MNAGQTFGFWRQGTRVAIAGVLAGLLTVQSAHAAGLLVADGGLGGVLKIEEHSARVTVNGGITVTEVTQVFLNTENRAGGSPVHLSRTDEGRRSPTSACGSTARR